MARNLISYLLITLLVVILGGWLIQAQIGEPVVQIAERTAESIRRAGR